MFLCTYSEPVVYVFCIVICGNPLLTHRYSSVVDYTMSTKKTVPCIRCHNSCKQRRILTKFYANTETLNCKQVTKFRSTSATATASLVGSFKSISVHYRHRRDWLSSVCPCELQDVSTPKVCVQNVHRVLERKLEDVVATAWPLHRWPPDMSALKII